jgi:hypothetical protein
MNKTLIIPASITVRARQFFGNDSVDRESTEGVTFEPGSQIQRLENGTFCSWISLKSTYIPASIEFIAIDCCFDWKSNGHWLGWPFVEGDAGSQIQSLETARDWNRRLLWL